MVAFRIPRLTLFSGPNCSLCDIAKIELAKVRQSRAFQLDIINIQDKGQEKWKKKYVYWIPALHLEGKEIAKGRWDEQIVNQALKQWDQEQSQQASELVFPFFADLSPYGWESFVFYERTDTDILGTRTEKENDEDDVDPTANRSRCFNCGHPDHKVTECPFRANRELIALSRQYYEFYQSARGLGNSQRLHTVEAWRQQRLNWLEEFEPGIIKGELLTDAVSNSNDEWLKNISVWGYPLGWVSHLDPRERVRDRIWSENDGDVAEELETEESFQIHGDEEVVELVSFKDAFHQHDHSTNSPQSEIDVEAMLKRTPTPTSSLSGFASRSPSAPPLPSVSPVRWATYPTSYFCSQALVLYTPPTRNEPWYSGVFNNTDEYLNQFSASNQPPPPQDEPPPLPPGPPDSGFPQNTLIRPPQFASSLLEIPVEVKQDAEEGSLSECDMELSDSD
ncbi:hypothetical protein BYT27DRAFT_7232397 [Phlegmacium glaucopus]|nr:hypothetical protein BYT27DRAFT_7232397 [Phlegmacium glaucopus]